LEFSEAGSDFDEMELDSLLYNGFTSIMLDPTCTRSPHTSEKTNQNPKALPQQKNPQTIASNTHSKNQTHKTTSSTRRFVTMQEPKKSGGRAERKAAHMSHEGGQARHSSRGIRSELLLGVPIQLHSGTPAPDLSPSPVSYTYQAPIEAARHPSSEKSTQRCRQELEKSDDMRLHHQCSSTFNCLGIVKPAQVQVHTDSVSEFLPCSQHASRWIARLLWMCNKLLRRQPLCLSLAE
jgi:hypothetical protein